MVSLDLEAIKARAEKATGGDWVPCTEQVLTFRDEPRSVVDGYRDSTWIVEAQTEADADFIACAHEDIPALVAEVERLQRVQAAAERVLTSMFVDVWTMQANSLTAEELTLREALGEQK